MKKILIAILAVIGGLSIFAGFGVLALLVLASSGGEPAVPARTILEIDFEDGVIEDVPDDPIAQFMLGGHLEVRDVVDALDRAAEDRRVKGVVARIGNGGMGLGHIQEIRDAVARFRRSGKPAIAWAETFGEFGAGNGAYYLATAFDEVYLQPSGDIGLTGLIYETQFIRGLLDLLDIVPAMGQRHEYKNAMNVYTDTEYSPAFREAMQSLVDSQFSQIVGGIAEGRELTADEVRELADRGPFYGVEAEEAGLVDGLLYRDQVYSLIRERTGERTRLLYLDPYLARAGRPHASGTTVAFIQGSGGVTRGPSAYSPMDGTITMGSDTIAGAIRAAIADRRVEAILLRVDSPGGSYIASDTIWRETIRARDAGKPVVVSLGNLGASGGYFVAMNADKIVAQPGTITGSIGVLGGKMITTGVYGKLGITFDNVQSSANSDQWSQFHDYSEAGRERFEAGLDRVYEDFTGKVAEGRNLPLEVVQQIARGRVWTGEQALEHGLIDAVGGMDVAVGLLRVELGLEHDAPIRLKTFPRERSAWDALFGDEPDSSEQAAMVALAEGLRTLQPVFRTIRAMEPKVEQQLLASPEIPPLE